MKINKSYIAGRLEALGGWALVTRRSAIVYKIASKRAETLEIANFISQKLHITINKYKDAWYVTNNDSAVELAVFMIKNCARRDFIKNQELRDMLKKRFRKYDRQNHRTYYDKFLQAELNKIVTTDKPTSMDTSDTLIKN